MKLRASRWIILTLIQATIAHGAETENRVPQDVFDGMRESFRSDKAKGVRARYEFNLAGPNGGHWWIEVTDGAYRMGRGMISHPDIVLAASDKDWVALSNGRLSGVWATLTGRLKIRGDPRLARKLDEIFP
jgi:putative sterol carrier protein